MGDRELDWPAFPGWKINSGRTGHLGFADLVCSLPLYPYRTVGRLARCTAGTIVTLLYLRELLDHFTCVCGHVGVVNGPSEGGVHAPYEPIISHPVRHQLLRDLETLTAVIEGTGLTAEGC